MKNFSIKVKAGLTLLIPSILVAYLMAWISSVSGTAWWVEPALILLFISDFVSVTFGIVLLIIAGAEWLERKNRGL